jgi:opacity protein-like surface antigen
MAEHCLMHVIPCCPGKCTFDQDARLPDATTIVRAGPTTAVRLPTRPDPRLTPPHLRVLSAPARRARTTSILKLLLAISVLVIAVLAFVLIASASAADMSKAEKLRASRSVVAWYHGKGAWHLRPGYATCSKIASSSAAGRCYRHRLGYRWHKHRIAALAPTRSAIRYRSAWLCLQRSETPPPFPAWRTASGNGYYGGLQMDLAFQRTYGPELLKAKGTANNWTAEEQMIVAERAHDGYAGHAARGFGPWPNTRHDCGL